MSTYFNITGKFRLGNANKEGDLVLFKETKTGGMSCYGSLIYFKYQGKDEADKACFFNFNAYKHVANWIHSLVEGGGLYKNCEVIVIGDMDQYKDKDGNIRDVISVRDIQPIARKGESARAESEEAPAEQEEDDGLPY